MEVSSSDIYGYPQGTYPTFQEVSRVVTRRILSNCELDLTFQNDNTRLQKSDRVMYRANAYFNYEAEEQFVSRR